MQKDQSFGELILTLNTIIEGQSLVYGYSNTIMPDLLTEFQIEFRRQLTDYLNTQSEQSKKFLDLCVENYQSIVKCDFSFWEG